MKLIKSLLLIGILVIAGCSLNVQNAPAIPTKVVYNEYNITNTLTENYSENIKSVVTIVERYTDNRVAYENIATGLIYAKNGQDYYILTTVFNLTGASDSSFSLITYDYQNIGLTYHASYIPFNIAIFKFTSSAEYQVAQISDINNLKINDFIYSIGTVLSKSLNNTLQSGNVSGLDRVAEVRIDDDTNYGLYAIQTTLLYSEGIYGSPVYNLAGDVIGMLSIFYTSPATSTSSSIEGTSFFIPIKSYEHVIESLISTKSYSKGLIGIIATAQSNITNAYGTNKGYYIDSVSPTGAAYSAGIQSGSLMTYINDIEIITSVEVVKELLKFKTGDTIKIRTKSNPSASEIEYTIVLG